MSRIQSRISAQGQISVPAAIRRKLGLGPGAVLEWEEDGERVFVRKAGLYSSEEIHRALFPDPPHETVPDTKEAIRKYIRKKHAGR